MTDRPDRPDRPRADRPAVPTIIGIDLGTSNTAVAVVRNGKVSVLAGADGARAIPSVVSIPRTGELVVGAEARRRIATDPSRTIASPKRLLGRRLADREVQTFVAQAAYRTLPADDGTVLIEVDGEAYAVPQLCGFILDQARALAERQLGDVRLAVLAVPVSFDESRCRAVEVAARLAGLEVVGLIAEPNAAALANRYVPGFGGLVGIYDFGGGTFDFSIVDVSRSRFQVMASAGDPWLGGDDIDAVLSDAAANQFWRQHKVDLRKHAAELQRLRFACEEAKRTLSTADTTRIEVKDVLRTAEGMVGLKLSLDRATLSRAAGAIVRRSLDVADRALAQAGLQPGDLSAVYLCGGSSQMPAVREAVQRHFGVPLQAGVPPDQAVAIGAAIHGSLIALRRSSPIVAARG
ncbi:MAG: Hsp70 family protein [Myxococcales bacterium]|nr:Hsp70 family protein [Myxococcales bacterium]